MRGSTLVLALIASALIASLIALARQASTPSSDPKAPATTAPATTAPATTVPATDAPPPVAPPDAPANTAAPDPTVARSAPNTQPPADYPEPVPVVKLLDPGSEPRRELRLSIDKPTEQTFKLRNELASESVTDGVAQKPPTPAPTEFIIRVAMRPDTSPGTFLRTLTVSNVDALPPSTVDPEFREKILRRIGILTELSVDSTVNGRNIILSNSLKMPKTPNPLMVRALDFFRSSIRELTPAFPEEPVGIGATWEVRTSVPANGIPVDAVLTYRLVSVSDDGATIAFDESRSASPQRVTKIFGMVPEGKIDIIACSGSVSGQSRLLWAQPIPIDANLSGVVSYEVNVIPRETAMHHKQTDRISATISPPAAK